MTTSMKANHVSTRWQAEQSGCSYGVSPSSSQRGGLHLRGINGGDSWSSCAVLVTVRQILLKLASHRMFFNVTTTFMALVLAPVNVICLFCNVVASCSVTTKTSCDNLSPM